MPCEKCINGSLKLPKIHPLSFLGNRCLSNSLIHSRELSTNQGGPNVQPRLIQSHLVLGLWINSMAQGPNVRSAQDPSPNLPKLRAQTDCSLKGLRSKQPMLARILPSYVVLARHVVPEQDCSLLVTPSFTCPTVP